jgi:hypothetical protein
MGFYMFMYDIATNQWTTWPMTPESCPLYQHRYEHSAAVDDVRGRMYITGGSCETREGRADRVENMEEWHFNSDDNGAGAPFLKAVHGMHPRVRHSSHVFSSATLMVMGGGELFTTTTGGKYYESASDNSLIGLASTVDSWEPNLKQWRREYHLTPNLCYLSNPEALCVRVLDENRMYWEITERGVPRATQTICMLSTCDPLTLRVTWELLSLKP